MSDEVALLRSELAEIHNLLVCAQEAINIRKEVEEIAKEIENLKKNKTTAAPVATPAPAPVAEKKVETPVPAAAAPVVAPTPTPAPAAEKKVEAPVKRVETPAPVAAKKVETPAPAAKKVEEPEVHFPDNKLFLTEKRARGFGLTLRQAEEALKVLVQFDVDKDNALNPAEFAAVMSHFNKGKKSQSMLKRTADMFFSSADKDGDGKLNFDELLELYPRLEKL
eukprot:TRINITY_DN4335_c0_g1_i1.p1 TRINITY_DN4335_c0_g1~~TRINITY_DN4335_c0_g1_i1.p1  ORF type:complete len:223 (+),score=138.42 TRINITY_DN4335_c0_g1_i1:25-693(+)